VNQGSSALHVDTADMGSELIMSLIAHTRGELYQYPRDVLDIKGRLMECKSFCPT
jgi:hypothetical protein